MHRCSIFEDTNALAYGVGYVWHSHGMARISRQRDFGRIGVEIKVLLRCQVGNVGAVCAWQYCSASQGEIQAANKRNRQGLRLAHGIQRLGKKAVRQFWCAGSC